MENTRKLVTGILFCVLVMISVAGCGSAATPTPQTNLTPSQEQGQEGKQTSYPVTIKDDSGKEVTIAKKPKRIISIIPSATETAFALGLGKKMVGVSDWDNYPEEVKNIEKIGGLDVSSEKIVSLQPDLILANTSNGKSVDALRTLGLPVLVLDANSLEDTFADMETIAKVTDTSDKAKEMITKMKAERDEVVKTLSDLSEDKRKKVWIEVGPELYTTGNDTFLNELVTIAGGKNVINDVGGWPQISEEKVVQVNPEVILYTYGYYIPHADEQIKKRKNWQQVQAIKTGQVFEVDSDMVTRPGPRITQGLQQMARFLYPEKFKK